jgi:hypothetical protein
MPSISSSSLLLYGVRSSDKRGRRLTIFLAFLGNKNANGSGGETSNLTPDHVSRDQPRRAGCLARFLYRRFELPSAGSLTAAMPSASDCGKVSLFTTRRGGLSTSNLPLNRHLLRQPPHTGRHFFEEQDRGLVHHHSSYCQRC